MNLQGTKTEQNLLKAFAGESQARNRYSYFANQARKDGFENIARQFEETANQEKEHARMFFSFLTGGTLEITASFPAGKIRSTVENLKAAIEGEHMEYSDLYPYFAKVAREEGFMNVANLFDRISIAEKQHEKQFQDLVFDIENQRVFSRDSNAQWKCLNCGYVHNGMDAPKACPVCAYPQSHFTVI